MSKTAGRKISVIGVGLMGGGIARNLIRQGFDVTVHDRQADRVDACAALGGASASSVADAVAGADVVITSLPTPEAVTDVITEHVEKSPEGCIWMDVSTIDPTTAIALEKVAQGAARTFVSCALGRGPAQAEDGTMPLFIGGDADTVASLEEVLTAIGGTVHVMGGVAAAASFKVVSNMIGMTNLAVLAEGYALCSAAGVSADAFTAALRDTGGWSAQGDIRLPLMVSGDYENRFATDLALKDVRLAVDMAARYGVPAPVGAAGLMQLAAAHHRGWGTEDAAAVHKLVSSQE